MVSTNHKNAEYYFNRDLQGVIDFFKRKFEFTSIEPPPKFSEIERKHNLDVELAASGFSKQIENEIEEMENEFRPVIGGNETEEIEGNDEIEDEIEEPEPPTKTTSRFDEWLENTAIGEEIKKEEIGEEEIIDEQRIEKANEIINRNQENDPAEEINDQLADLDVHNNNFGN